MSKIFQTGLVAALIASVAGHTAVEKFEAGGKTYAGFYQASKKDPGNQSPAWWTNQGWGYQPVFGSKLSHPYVYLVTATRPQLANVHKAISSLTWTRPHHRTRPKHQPVRK